MSYCRWGEQGSDVYVYASEYDEGDRVVELWVCMHLETGSFSARSEQEMIDHLLAHRANGDTVPESALDRLRKEMGER